jgi:hypothetical protein
MIIYPVKENYISSVVSEFLGYKQTDRQTNILLLYYMDDIYKSLDYLQGIKMEFLNKSCRRFEPETFALRKHCFKIELLGILLIRG